MSLRTTGLMLGAIVCVIGLAWLLGEQDADTAPTPHVWVHSRDVAEEERAPELATAPRPGEPVPLSGSKHEEVPRVVIFEWILRGEFLWNKDRREQFVAWINELRNLDAFIDHVIEQRRQSKRFHPSRSAHVFELEGIDAARLLPRVRTRLDRPGIDADERAVLSAILVALGVRVPNDQADIVTRVLSNRELHVELRTWTARKLIRGGDLQPDAVRAIEELLRDFAENDTNRLVSLTLTLHKVGTQARPFVGLLLELRSKIRGSTSRILDIVTVANPAHAGARAFYIDCVDHYDVSVRRRAMEALSKEGPAAVEEFVTMLESASASKTLNGVELLMERGIAKERQPGFVLSVLATGGYNDRDRAIKLLARVAPDPQQALPVVRDLLSGNDKGRWLSGTKALGALTTGVGARDDILQLLFVAARLPDPKVRVTAVQSLLMYDKQAERVTEALVDLLQDTEAEVRREAVDGLGEISATHESARSHLQTALGDSDESVRKLAKYWLHGKDDE